MWFLVERTWHVHLARPCADSSATMCRQALIRKVVLCYVCLNPFAVLYGATMASSWLQLCTGSELSGARTRLASLDQEFDLQMLRRSNHEDADKS